MLRIALLLASTLALTVNLSASACDTPVYRYAMYKWESSPYEIYFFHDSDLSKADIEVSRALEEIESRLTPRSNVVYIPVDLRKENALKRVPADVRRRWDDRDEKSTPAYLTVSPVGGLVSWQSLTSETVSAMVDSPIRKQIAADLSSAKAGVLVVLSGKDPLATDTAKKEVLKLQKQLAAGEIPLYRPPTDPLSAGPGKASDDKMDIGVVMIDRDEETEQWLVDSLLAVEGDLRDLDQPMVFPVYGRGRVLPPFVGAGITATNLADAVAFVTGACSCTVKDQNPGVDLLMTHDWASAADAMKEKFGNEEGNEEFGGADLFPQLIIPGETGIGPKEEPVPFSEDAANSDLLGQPKETASAGDSVPHPEEQAVAMADHEHSHASASEDHGDASHHSGGDSSANKMYLTLGIGFGLGLLLLAGGTLFVFRSSP